MLWLAVLTMPDGSRVESSLVAAQTPSAGPVTRAYRLRRADGSITDFSTLASVVGYLVDHYDPDDLSRAASRHRTLTAGLAAAAGANLTSSTRPDGG